MANITDEHWQFEDFPYSGAAVEFRDNGEWRRYGTRFNQPEERSRAVEAIMSWAKELGYTLAGPSD